jgi:hypothetical protein
VKPAPALFRFFSNLLAKFRGQSIIGLVGSTDAAMFGAAKSFNPVDLLRKREIADEKTTHCSRETLRSATAGAQPEAHLAAPRVLQVAQEKPARGL